MMHTQESSRQEPVIAEKPQNGLAGLKHWRSDMLAGLLVSLVSLPFSLGIAIASGAPPDGRADFRHHRRAGLPISGWVVRHDQRTGRGVGSGAFRLHDGPGTWRSRSRLSVAACA